MGELGATRPRVPAILPPAASPIVARLLPAAAFACLLAAAFAAACEPPPSRRLLAVVVDLSGPGRGEGLAIRNGARLAVRRARASAARGAAGLTDLQLVVKDDRGDPALALQLARELVKVPEVIAVINASTDATAEVSLPVYDDEGPRIPVLVPAALSPTLMEKREWVFSVAPAPAFLGEALAWFLITELAADSAASLYDRRPYGRAFEQGFSRELQRLGGGLRHRMDFDSTLVNLTALSRAAHEAPVSLLAGPAAEVARVLSALRAAGVNGPLLISDPREVAPSAAEGPTFYPLLFDPRGHRSAREFTRSFTRTFGHPPDAAAALAYDAANLVLEGLAAGAEDRGALRDWLAEVGETAPHAGVTGTLFFSRNHYAVRDIPIASQGRTARVATHRRQ